MRKIFTTLKSVVAASVIAAMTLAASCSYDDAPLTERVDRVEKDLASLTERVAALEKRLGEEVEALTALINGKVVVTSVEKDGDATKVTLSDGSSFTVYPECTVVDTDTDTDTNTYISIAEQDGVLYFAVYEMGEFKEWLLINGEMVPVYDGNDQDDNVCDDPYVPADPIAPQFKVEGENIMVSIDGGQTWVESGLLASAAGAQIFTGVKVNENNTVTFTLADGSTFDVVIAELIEFNTTRGQLYVKPGEVKEITVTINDSVADVNVMNQPLGWKAEIAPKAADENEGGDDVDPGMGILAAGGTEFVLKVTGPSQDFVNAGYAEEKGYITVHFNSDNGACKVGKVAVEMANITLDIDKAGMVTVTSTWVDSYLYSDWYGEQTITEFNNYYVAIMDIADYTEDLASIYNASWYEFNVPCVGGWINNFYYNVNEEYNTTDKGTYREGENEKWTFQAHLSDIIGVLDWGGEFTFEGNSFMVLVIPTDPQAYGALLLDQALAVPFKQLNVKAEVVETTWNDAFLNATLRGANGYYFNINNKADLQSQIDNGWYDGYEGYYNDYIYYWQNYGSSFGSHRVTTDVVAEGISFNELINYGEEYPDLYELAPNTTYIVAILAEEDGKTEYSYEDLIRFEFTTADVTEAATPFEYTIVRDDEQTNYFKIFANVTVPETAVAVYSVWENEEIVEDLKGHLIANGWVKNDFSQGYTYELNTTVNAAGDEKILYIMIVDAEGNYSIGQQTLTSQEVVVNENVNLTIENVEFLTEANGGVANITLGGLEDVEYSYIKAYVCATDGNSYYLRSEEDLQDLAYGTDYLYVQYDTNPFKVTRTGDYKYQATEGKTYIVAVAVQLADGTVTNVVYQEIPFTAGAEEPEEPEEPAAADYNVEFTAVEYLGEAEDYYTTYSQFKFTNEAGNWMILAMHPNDVIDGTLPVGTFPINWTDQGEVYGNATMISKELFNMTYDPYITSGEVVISKTDDVYTVVVNGKDLYLNGVSGKTLKATFEGTMTTAEEGGDDSGEGADVTVVSAVAGAHGDFVGETLVTFTMSDDSTFGIAFKTGDNKYLTPGTWQGNSWSDPNYITYIYRNDESISSYTEVEVSYADGAYTIGAFQPYNWNTGAMENFPGYTGAIEGLDAPAE